MSDSNQKKWIILINKSPRGPFIETEIRDLLKQGIVRHNDLAFLVTERPEEGHAQWKFMWQFPEFDSRAGEKNNPPPAAVLEKRTPKTESQIKAQVDENVPVDLKAITIDDLILRVNSAPKREVLVTKIGEEKERYQSTSFPGHQAAFNSKVTSVLFAMIAVIGILYAGFKEFYPGSREANREVAQEKKMLSPGGAAGGPPKARLEGDLKKQSVATPAPDLGPRERDRGEIREDEILRMREEERRREASEREKERQLREAEESNEEGESEESEEDAKSKSKGARKTASEETEESDDEEKSLKKQPGQLPPNQEEEPPASWLE